MEKIKELSLREYPEIWEEDWDKNLQYREPFIAGYNTAIEKVKEYLFNTEQHQNKDDKFYISEDYLKQTIKFLNEQ